MTFGSQVGEAEAKEFLNYFLNHGGHNIDTAIAYNKGKTETIIGNVLTPEQKKATCILSLSLPPSHGFSFLLLFFFAMNRAKIRNQIAKFLPENGKTYVQFAF
jgi:aryl-alcohol dehydrogenase-like predicted oxidoreductase